MKAAIAVIVLASISAVGCGTTAQPAKTDWFLKGYLNGEYTMLHDGHKYLAHCTTIADSCSVLIAHIGEFVKFQQGDDAGKNSDLLFLEPFNGGPIPKGFTPDLVALTITSVQ